ncbi:MAG: GxxExxY protein [Candidatus Omnitrophica bacterium]|nr:GxxExxY protein [Candidatus Omnitrophota bacterium]MBU4479524.1 GxxExxY protein [Candidatus Omnitrophota bacterium]
MEYSKLADQIIGYAIEVHRILGPGLLESTYEQCLAQELRLNKINFNTQLALPVTYKGIRLDCGYRIDMLIENEIILEIKSVEEIQGIHQAQVLTYMKLANIKHGFIVNFNVKYLKEGLKSFIL